MTERASFYLKWKTQDDINRNYSYLLYTAISRIINVKWWLQSRLECAYRQGTLGKQSPVIMEISGFSRESSSRYPLPYHAGYSIYLFNLSNPVSVQVFFTAANTVREYWLSHCDNFLPRNSSGHISSLVFKQGRLMMHCVRIGKNSCYKKDHVPAKPNQYQTLPRI